MLVAEALGLAEPDAVDNTGVVKLVRDDSIIGCQASLEEASVGVESTWIEDSIFKLMEVSNSTFQVLMDILSAANEAHRGHAEAMCVQGVLGRLNDTWMIRKPQVIVGAEVKHTLPISIDFHVLSGRDHALNLVGASFLHCVKVGLTHGF